MDASPQGSWEADEEDKMLYGAALDELDDKYPNRPRNHSLTLVFSQLFLGLFNPLNENKGQPPACGLARLKAGGSKLSPHEQRRAVIQRFIARWRAEVGNDFYPVLRLILPDKDRDRGVYGLKENTIGKLLVKLMKISSESEDGHSLLKWKLPGHTFASRMAGDFAGRCYEILSKRQMRSDVGDMRIARVNELLDRLAAASGETEQLPIFQLFYENMNAEEMMWLIRIILKQMKVGATERTFLDLWHPDGEALFSVSSSLRRVCWELYDPQLRLEQEETGVTLMQCFQPQLAQFQMPESFERMVQHLRPMEDDAEFWIEEKLDGERVQMHMVEDDATPGGYRFCFWSRKGKDYTYLYGSGFEDDKAALTRHLRTAFDGGVRNIILDGEMVTWDPKIDKMVPFGTLKTAALLGQKTPFDENNERPLFRVFDILYLNDEPLTRYTLRDRHRALERAVPGVHRRLEIHAHESATTADAIEPLLRKAIADSSEGLVLKNPRSSYRLNSRNGDWLKVKPEYMSEFGESLDCLVVGGYFGSGRRGGTISSFLCGLRVGENHVRAGANPEKCISFCKVGGGFRAEDYAQIRHLTEGKWIDWDPSCPPSEYIELGGGEKLQYERPDVWIRPRDSIVLSIKAASVGPSDQFGMKVTLRFPRFRRLRSDRSWDSSLDVDEFWQLKDGAEREAKGKMEMRIEDRKRRPTKRARRELVIAGQDVSAPGPEGISGPAANVFEGFEFCVLSESVKPTKMTKAQVETLIKRNGGRISQKADPNSAMYLVADKNVVKVASLIKQGDDVNIIRPKWLLDCLGQSGGGYVLPFERGHLFHASESLRRLVDQNTDEFGDSYARDVDTSELADILDGMPKLERSGPRGEFDKVKFLDELQKHRRSGVDNMGKGMMFRRCVVYCVETGDVSAVDVQRLRNYVLFGGGSAVEDGDADGVTHVAIVSSNDTLRRGMAAEWRAVASLKRRPPRIVNQNWLEESWNEGTLLDEEAFVPF